MNWMNVGMVAAAYFLGAIPFGYLIAKTKGVDIRQAGSGNIGATNVERVLGKTAGKITLLCDGLKGLLPVLLARAATQDERWLAAVALATIIGHNWPVYLQFKGGKGVTTTYGSFLGLAWLPAAQTILIWVAVKKMTKTASIAALTSSACAPLFVIGFFHQPSRFQTGASALVFAVITAVLIYLRHIPNIQRLLANEEMPSKKA